MGSLYENITALCSEKGIKPGKMCTDIGISRGLITDLKMGRKSDITSATAQKIASYLGVSVGRLLGEETEKAPIEADERKFKDDEIMFALSRGGEAEITEAMFEEVKNFARFVAQREADKKNNVPYSDTKKEGYIYVLSELWR